MRSALVFWAQALDNSAPDHVHLGDVELPPDDPRRPEVVRRVSRVMESAHGRAYHGAVRCADDGRDMVLEVPSRERDAAGRTAPIVCCGELAAILRDGGADAVADSVERFARRIGRSVAPGQRAAILAAIAEKKSSRARRLLLQAALAAAFVLVMSLAVFSVVSRMHGRG